MIFRRMVGIALLVCAICGFAQITPMQNAPAAPGPELRTRPAPTASSAARQNRLHIDVVVDDAAGTPITGLQPWDFNLFDNGQPSKIVYFRAFDGAPLKMEPPVEIILMLDELNLSFSQVATARDQIVRFLERNGGQLAHPVSLMVLSDAGLEVQPRPSVDGNALAAMLKNVNAKVSSINAAMGLEGSQERFRRSMRQIQFLADNESRKPGRKLVIWIGAGWPMLESQHFVPGPKDKDSYFQSIVSLSRWLREARMAVYSVSMPGGLSEREIYYQNYLKPVLAPRQAQSGNLALRVLAVQTGGRVLGPDNDLAGQIARCTVDANAYYQLTFEAQAAGKSDEYHDLRVQVSRPGAVVRTTAGYYSEPPPN